MLLQQIAIHNIRSYTNQIINLSEGSTVLAGDIGSGKSSLLQAAEFALFGTSRPDLPAEALLRKGCTDGYAELKFKLNNQEIIIRRHLKKDKTGIKQTSGYIIINNCKKELTAIELKAEIINLLGYPTDALNKNRNYIFRYTVYTPQEEMKQILQENPEIRLDVLRRIFNVDKYKNVRENIQIYLKQIRTTIAVLSTKLEHFEKENKYLDKVKEDKLLLEKLIEDLLPLIKELQNRIEVSKKEIELLESQQRQRRELELKFEKLKIISQQKNEHICDLELKCKNLEEELSQFAMPERIDDLKQRLNQLEGTKNQNLAKHSSLQEKIKQLQENIIRVKREIALLTEELLIIPEKEKLHQELAWKAVELQELKTGKEQLQNQLERTSSLIAGNTIVLAQAQKIKNNLSQLKTCPTCLQEVSEDHKHEISSQEDRKIQQAQVLLHDLEERKIELQHQLREKSLTIDKILESDSNLVMLYSDLQRLYKSQALVKEKQKDLVRLVQENNLLMQEISKLGSLNLLNQEILKLRKILEIITEKEFKQRALLEIKQEIVNEKKQSTENGQILEIVAKKLSVVSDNTDWIKIKRETLSRLLEEEKHHSVKLASLQADFNNLSREGQRLSKVIQEMLRQKTERKDLLDLNRWLESYFLPLTYTIEKQVMVNIHHLFNKLFQDWFAILIDDEEIYSRLDDCFTPVIEQNGYEILFSNLSGGEKPSASLAYRLALNKVINDVIQEIKTKNLIILDEPTDGFSMEQLDKVREVLDRLQLRQTIIVSHESKIESFVENVIRINKEKQESFVVC